MRILMKVDNTCHPEVAKSMAKMIAGLGGATSPLASSIKTVPKTWDKSWLLCNSGDNLNSEGNDSQRGYSEDENDVHTMSKSTSKTDTSTKRDDSAFSQLDDSIVSTTQSTTPSFGAETDKLFKKILAGNGNDLNLHFMNKYDMEGCRLTELSVSDKWLLDQYDVNDMDAQR